MITRTPGECLCSVAHARTLFAGERIDPAATAAALFRIGPLPFSLLRHTARSATRPAPPLAKCGRGLMTGRKSSACRGSEPRTTTAGHPPIDARRTRRAELAVQSLRHRHTEHQHALVEHPLPPGQNLVSHTIVCTGSVRSRQLKITTRRAMNPSPATPALSAGSGSSPDFATIVRPGISFCATHAEPRSLLFTHRQFREVLLVRPARFAAHHDVRIPILYRNRHARLTIATEQPQA